MKGYEQFAKTQARFVTKNSGWILLAITILTILAFPFAKNLSLKANLIDLLSPEMPSVIQLDRLTSEIGGTSFLVVAIESSDEETAQIAAREFSARAAGFSEIDYVDNRTDLTAFESRKLLFLTLDGIKDLDRQVQNVIGFHRRQNNPFFINLLDEEEPTVDVMSLELEEKAHRVGGFAKREGNSFMRVVLLKPSYPVSDFELSEKLFERTRETLDEVQKSLAHPFTFGFTGPYQTRYDEYHTIKSDLMRTGILTVVLVVLLVLAFFRSIRALLLAFVPLAIAIIWTAAFAQVAIGFLNLISALLLAILIGLGIDFAIHLLVAFKYAYRESKRFGTAIEKMYTAVAVPLLTSALTTSIAFASLTISDFRGFRDFGMIAGAGILFCFVCIFYGLPSFLVVFEKITKAKPHWHWPRAQWKLPQSKLIYGIIIGGVLFSIFSLTQVPQVQFEYDFSKLQEKNSESIRLADRIGKYFGVVLNPVAIVTNNRARAAEMTRVVNKYIDSSPETTFHFASSLASYVPKQQAEKMEVMKEIDFRLAAKEKLISEFDEHVQKDITELRRQLSATPLRLEDIPNGFREQYEGKAGNVSVVYVYPKKSLLDGREAKRFVREMRSMGLPEDVTVAGEPVVYADILIVLERDTPRAMLISVGVVVLLMFLHFRRVKHVVWVLAPVFLGFLWLAGMVKLVGFKLNYMNVAILPSILGVGIDNGIHIFHRYRMEKKATFFDIMKRTGAAVFLASLTTMAAFFTLLFARHQGIASFGTLGLLGFASCLATSVIFIPALIEFFELHYWDKLRKNIGFGKPTKATGRSRSERSDRAQMSLQANQVH